METLRIIHLHGSLGKLPWQKPDPAFDPRGYGVLGGTKEIMQASQQIKIIHENTDDDPGILEAGNILATAKRVCFLSFGYHRTNVRRLLGGRWNDRIGVGQIIGSAFGMTEAEKTQKLELFNGKMR